MNLSTLSLCLAVIVLTVLVPPAAGSPDAVSYEQYVTLVHDQAGQGGCVGQSVNHVLEILKEMEAPYTPDPSYGFFSYVFWSATRGGTDPRVPADERLQAIPLMATYGVPPETSFPTNFDVNGKEIADIIAHLPSDAAFTEAQAYRLNNDAVTLFNPSISQAEEWLATKGPLVCNQLFPGHTVALIGYNRTAGEFTIVDSANWMSPPYPSRAGIKRVPYAVFASRQQNMTLEAVTNRLTPLIHPYTARIRISHDQRRSLLTVKIGAVGHDPVTVWDRNNHVNYTDLGTDLAIDVPLPSYAAEHWPPSAANPWYVQVTNHDDPSLASNRACLREVTLAKRQTDSSPLSVEAYTQNGMPIWVDPGTVEIRFPLSLKVTSPNGGECWNGGELQTITWTQAGLAGTTVDLLLLRGDGSGLPCNIGLDVPADAGSVTWRVPTLVEPGLDYFVRVRDTTYSNVLDRSDGNVEVIAPSARFTSDRTGGYEPLAVQFTDTSDGHPVAWSWNFGDGQTSSLRDPSHTYGAGTYPVSLTVTYADGGTKTATKINYITVMPTWNGLVRTEAEDYMAGGEGVAYHDTTAGNSGGDTYRQDDVDIAALGTKGHVVTRIAEGEWTRYQVWSDAAGTQNYPLSLRLAGWAGQQTITVAVAGMAGSIDVAVPNTASSTTYAYANATLRLKPGLNTIQFTYHGSAMNFDYFTLDPSGIPVATPTPTPTPLQLVVVPGGRALPADWENDGLYEDVNGNGGKDFADVVLYFNQLKWIIANEPLVAFDYNGNGRIDFADVVWLFNNL